MNKPLEITSQRPLFCRWCGETLTLTLTDRTNIFKGKKTQRVTCSRGIYNHEMWEQSASDPDAIIWERWG